MAQHRFYDPIDNNMVTKLGVKAQLCGYCFGTDEKRLFGHIYKTDQETYSKIQTILNGRPNVEIKEGDKVFVLPGYPLTHDRLKEYLKRIKASLTNDITKATYIAGNNSFAEVVGFYYGSQPDLVKTLMFQVAGSHIVLDPTEMSGIPEDVEIDKSLEFHISGQQKVRGGLGKLDTVSYPHFFLTPAVMEILYNLLSRKLPVGDLSCLAKKANSSVKLDKEAYEAIDAMLGSNNSSDVTTGVNLLTHCDYTGEEAEYLLWKLARKHQGRMYTPRRTKTIEFFMRDSNWNKLGGYDEEEFLLHRKESNTLTSEVVRDLLPIILKNTVVDAGNMVNNDYFDVHMTETSVTFSFNSDWIQSYNTSKNAEPKPQ